MFDPTIPLFTEPCLPARSDSYKWDHFRQYPPGSQRILSYMSARGGEFDEVIFFGLQYYIARYLAGVVVTRGMLDRCEALARLHFGGPVFNRAGWEYIITKHGGRLPLRIRAVPEGTPVPVKNAVMLLENTDEVSCAWLTNWVETLLSKVWYTSAVATQSREMKRDILYWLERTGDPAGIDYKLHDFGMRGVTCEEQAGLGGAAHLVNFRGTDTIAGILLANQYYDSGVCGHSIPATEHSTITSWGRDNEVEAYRNFLTEHPTGLIACVSDAYDIYRACEELWGEQLHDQVMARDGTLVVRPDSGDMFKVVPRVLGILGDKFGFTVNPKGYRVLDPHVRTLQGDGINRKTCNNLYECIAQQGWSADNLALGSGGALLQALTRDTTKNAIKCSSIRINGEDRDVYKDPVTDPGKASLRGRLALVKIDGTYQTVREEEAAQYGGDLLVTVFENGAMTRRYTWDEVRANATVTARAAAEIRAAA